MKYPLPDHVVRLISKADRIALNLKTMDEINAAAETKSERDLHKYIRGLLQLRGIEFIESQMHRKSTNNLGTPDFLFAVKTNIKPSKEDPWGEAAMVSVPCAWEVKMPGRVLDPEQKAMFERMTADRNAWCCRVIRSVQEALDELRKLGL